MSPMRDGQTTNDDERTREDSATQPNGCWMAEFRNLLLNFLFVQRLNQFSKANRTIRLSGTKIMLTSDIMS